MKIVLTALSVAFLMVFSFNVFSQGNKPQQEDKGKKSCCMAMMESKDMQAMCAKMMGDMKDGDMKMDGNMKMDGKKGKAVEPKSQKL
ncbi:hypothetical protein MKJ04_19925 [Pontibacter sp. E15-1]|uniref:hypothetical protein n=1 Tax=Pontibacter sp. E15-1 TaxID=2919918 RepID=UPI001F4F43E4|nr:hypothetical protein [Pontibacter sp. E15-1]MCJ8167119.1 hypothetical protein [Pontibacter sp. E15-1]